LLESQGSLRSHISLLFLHVFGKVITGMEHVDTLKGNDKMESIRVTEAV
jgi:hypothetical protein